MIVLAGTLLAAPFAMAGWMVAQESPLPPLVNAGVLGALAVCFILGLIVPKAMLDRAEARADRADERAEASAALLSKEVVPVLQTAIAAVQAADTRATAQMQQDAELRVLLSQVRDALEREARR